MMGESAGLLWGGEEHGRVRWQDEGCFWMQSSLHSQGLRRKHQELLEAAEGPECEKEANFCFPIFGVNTE